MPLTPPTSPLGDIVDRQAATNDGIALVMPSGVRLSYPELAQRTDAFASSLIGLGVRSGDHVGILMHNCLDFVLALIATAKVGAVSVPINGRFREAEASYIIDHADLSILLVNADDAGTDYPRLVHRVLNPPPGDAYESIGDTLRHVVDFSGRVDSFLTRAQFDAAAAGISLDELKNRQNRVRIRDIALLMYTSGTTSRPKGCLLTHESISRHGPNVAQSFFSLTEDDAFWDPLPLFHCGGIVPMFACFTIGATYCHAGHFEPGQALRTIRDEKCTVLYPAFEAIWLPILDHPEFATSDLSHVRVVQNIATPERMTQFENRMPWAPQVTSYGATETASNLTMGHPDDPLEVRVNTLGRVVPGMEAKIVDPDTGNEVPDEEFGELCYRGYALFQGYYKSPEINAAVFDAEGFFHSGDRAARRLDGNFIYGGRYKDMLKVGGENVAAIEIEDLLVHHPAVRVAQVVGVRDARYGEVPAAFIELNPNLAATEADIIEFCVNQIATYKVPRYIRFVVEWPMSGTKVKKFELQNHLIAELDRDGIHTAPRSNARVTTD
ncbi:AMP-binding protein [Microbacterium sp. A94]|uniref:AMP-binding protein n=1 Tax=Microbacterium sp. A94 TaxID=3450717 RepID=UPI003F43E061